MKKRKVADLEKSERLILKSVMRYFKKKGINVSFRFFVQFKGISNLNEKKIKDFCERISKSLFEIHCANKKSVEYFQQYGITLYGLTIIHDKKNNTLELSFDD